MSRTRLLPLASLFLLAACAPDEGEDTDTAVDEGAPVASLSDAALDLGWFCEPPEGSVTIENTGDAVLTLETPTLTNGWALVGEAPGAVEPGDAATITVAPGTEGGDGALTVATNDPDLPTLTVALSAQANQPPQLTLEEPGIIAPGATGTITGVVSDDEDTTTLELAWASDVDGALTGEAPDGAGAVALTWDGAVRTSGDHTVTASVTDSCGATAQDSVTLCQNEGYVEDNIDLESWTFAGSTGWDADNGWLDLTPDSRYTGGSAFMTTETVPSDDVSIAFRFYAGDKDGSGADGFSVTAIDTERATTYTGSVGGGLGYGDLPGWTVEVDTWDNTGDPGYSEPTRSEHVALVIDGASRGNGVAFAEIPNVEDGAWHDMLVEVTGQRVQVSIDGTLYIDQDVPEITTFPAHIGFTAATGAAYNAHRIDALEVEGFICE